MHIQSKKATFVSEITRQGEMQGLLIMKLMGIALIFFLHLICNAFFQIPIETNHSKLQSWAGSLKHP